MLVDIHAHLDFNDFDVDRSIVIDRAKNVGVSFVICNGVDIASNKKILSLSKKFSLIRPAFGLYPLDVVKLSKKNVDKTFDFIEKHVDDCVAFGEIGLDYTDNLHIDKQKEVLLRFFDLAKKYDKPVILHSRKAESDVVKLVQESDVKKAVFHCFSGKFRLVKEIEKLGMYLSIPPIINHSEHFQKIVKEVSLKNLLTETDSPFLCNVKGERNEPKNIVFTINKISQILQLDPTEVEKIIFMNAKSIFF
ncbi:MAG: TatD family hydrolase [Nanoarchaeota archaeon]